MGVKLIVEVLDGAPPALGPSQRLVLIVVAESANDQTREAWPSMDVLTRRTGLAANSVRRVLTDLSAAGVIERVPVGKDRMGAPVYAHRGHATVYRLTPFAPGKPGKPPAGERLTDEVKAPAGERLNGHKPPGSERLTGQKGAHLRAERRSSPSERRSPASPLPSVPSENPHITARELEDERAAVIEALRFRTGKTISEDHAERVARQLLDGRLGVRRRRAYLIGAIERDADPTRFLPTPTPPRFQAHEIRMAD